jgi:type I restriction enzyme S subunit
LGFQQTRPIKAKSVLFVCIGSTIGKVAQNLKECATNQQINSIIAGPGTSADFLYYLLSECSEGIAEIAGNQAVPIINKSLFSGFKVLCPKKDEQHRIAACLTTLDTRIAAQVAKIDALKTHKRGLMQQLFPAPEEQ